METELILANKGNANIIRNLYPLYLYDLSEIYGHFPNQYGIYEDETIKTLTEQYPIQDAWFQNPDSLHPFIIFVDKKPAGFMLISEGKHAPKDTEYFVYEFFLLRPYRSKNIAGIAAIKGFEHFKGKWALYTNPTTTNKKAQSFWNKTVSNYTSGKFDKSVGSTFDGEKLIFSFNNSGI